MPGLRITDVMTSTAAKLNIKSGSHAVIIVAHPDDETLWTGGVVLMHPEVRWTILTVCRKSDPDRAPRFAKACEIYGARGIMADLDDGSEQVPLPAQMVEDTLGQLMPSDRFDLVLTHGRQGEYTRHVRHEEVSRAVMALHRNGSLRAPQILHFAYDDSGGRYLPQPDSQAEIYIHLDDKIWQKKYEVITDIYKFAPDSWEARTTPKQEAFWRFGARQVQNTI